MTQTTKEVLTVVGVLLAVQVALWGGYHYLWRGVSYGGVGVDEERRRLAHPPGTVISPYGRMFGQTPEEKARMDRESLRQSRYDTHGLFA